MEATKRILVTGASGYVGGRLTTALRDRDYAVRCMARRPDLLAARLGPGVEVVSGDVLSPDSLAAALDGIDTAYYLIHSMGTHGDFADQDRQGAEAFARSAHAAGVRRIVYLGGLGDGAGLSDHLESRHEVGEILRNCGVQTLEFRASIIIGSGSLSFEMIRALVAKLPVMLTPKWVHTEAQPIAIEDVVDYLLAALDFEGDDSEVFEIGGADRASYRDIMAEYANQVGLRRHFLGVPVLTPALSSRWLGLVTPIYARVGQKLIDGVRNETVVKDDRARRVFQIQPRTLSQAIIRARHNEERMFAQTRWSDALSSSGAPASWGGERIGSRIVDSRTIDVTLSPEAAFVPIRRIGGKSGWYYGNILWRIRGWLDLLLGGPGMRRGRRDPETPIVGDTLDFWRVEAYEPKRLLRLYAEMKVPGRAWLQFEVEPTELGSRIRQTAIFEPRGLVGPLYWYSLYAVHNIMFDGMLRRIAERAAATADSDDIPVDASTSVRAA